MGVHGNDAENECAQDAPRATARVCKPYSPIGSCESHNAIRGDPELSGRSYMCSASQCEKEGDDDQLPSSGCKGGKWRKHSRVLFWEVTQKTNQAGQQQAFPFQLPLRMVEDAAH